MTQAEQKTVWLRHLVLAKKRAYQIMTIYPAGRHRLTAGPKEQPPRKLSGKRTSGEDGTLERSHLHKDGSPKG
ncbi:hypothetical protein RRU01S_14_01210 [Agrobacterium rubi TR3 = NBRC 13261]|uniref:Uncharacterized protein n=1 Tax=Agrobacterium rubi TR3 = NBRC 13261 TaxID=1368415 RepID=A0A081CW54_9HYPH|nr:hypothetical protein RRU01S_14_01210 [Agrobacterium rubi TR3 = NBRC 13261]